MPTLKKSSVLNVFTDGEEYFTTLRWKDKSKTCIRCNTDVVYSLSSGRLRCKECGLTFGHFTRTYLGKLNIPIYEIGHLLYLFALGIPVYRARHYVLVSMKTAHKAYTVFREALYAASLKELSRLITTHPELENELKTVFDSDKDLIWESNGKSVVIGIFENNEKVFIFPVPCEMQKDLQGKNLLNDTHSSLQCIGHNYCIGRLRVSGSHLTIPRVSEDEKTRHTSKLIPKFWNYLRRQLFIYHGISLSHHHLFLKELEFRFNNRDREIFTLLSEQLVKKVSDHTNN